MEGWGDERTQANDEKRAREANEKKCAAVGRVEEALRALKQDEFFQMDLKDPEVVFLPLATSSFSFSHDPLPDHLAISPVSSRYLPLCKVIRAINHWTGKNRLPPDQTLKFQDNYRVMAVLARVRKLQAICQDAGFGVPLERVLQGEVSCLCSH
jgi:hypothetical protein